MLESMPSLIQGMLVGEYQTPDDLCWVLPAGEATLLKLAR